MLLFSDLLDDSRVFICLLSQTEWLFGWTLCQTCILAEKVGIFFIESILSVYLQSMYIGTGSPDFLVLTKSFQIQKQKRKSLCRM